MIAFPVANPDDIIPARIEDGAVLAQRLTWDLDTVHASPVRSSPEYDAYLQDTVGSSYDWADEVRFDATSGVLRSLILKTPEAGTIDPSLTNTWLALPRQAGLPAISHETGFNIDPLDVRALSADGQQLLVLHASALIPDRDAVRLSVHSDLDLLFSRGRYCGWILCHPIAHLMAGDASGPGSASDSPELLELVREYLSLVVEPNVSRMFDRDPALGAALETIVSRARACRVPGPAAQVVARRADDVLDNFYG